MGRDAGRACCRAATRAPEGVCAGIFVANRSSARAERRERRRGPTAGAAGLRRANVSRDSKRLGARGSAWPCVSEVAAAARAPVPMVQLERGARVPRHFLELCEWFRDCSQASGASQRVQRASAPRPTPVGCGADGPAQHGPPRGRSRDRALLNSIDARLPRCSGSLPCQRGAHSVRRRMSLSVLRAARGQRVLCGTEWTLCAPTGGAALPGSAASPVPAARAPALARERARVRPQPIEYTAHARAAASAVRCESRVRRCAHLLGRVAARVFRADPSLGRWRCGPCASPLE